MLEVHLDVVVDYCRVFSIEITKDSTLNDLMKELKNDDVISTKIDDWECFSEQKQQYLKLNDNFEYTNRDKLIISKKKENDQNISSKLQSFKEQIDLKLKNLELLFAKILQTSRTNILKELEFYEQDIKQIQLLLNAPSNQKEQAKLIQQKVNLFNKHKEIGFEHISKIQSEFEKFQLNLQKEQKEFYNKQQTSFDQMKIRIDKTQKFDDYIIDYNREPRQMTIEIDPETQFEELFEYLAATGFPDIFYEYSKILGHYNSWLGSSEKLGNNVNLSEKLGKYQQDTIKIGPIHIIQTGRKIELNNEATVNFYYLKNLNQD